ncbi:MCP four helix bundle domain-containing protein [Pontibacter burrus]|uniref:Chemotaxis methyl-accepting receptor HlyB-like 4HB MCP domain-containing protein n=1 Tax=Pontibacter burrus TaxID=2704466 RepID=A0A6B3LPR5_9BACT|nr:MCP four helix bundle domain-containing protein [Pontibacter burrus]NEM98759.1 hypothetical protein [Pontibacter burrus]
MSWSFGINQRNKVSLAFAAVFVVIILANWVVSYSMEQVGKQFQSVYQDRLVPSLDISEILERYYQNRMLLEEHVLATQASSHDSLQQLIVANTTVIDSVVLKYEQTYLVESEKENLANYKTRFAELVQVQDRILALSAQGNKAEARKLYRTDGQSAFQGLLDPLHQLIKVQGDVGQELYQSANRSVMMLKVVSYSVIALAVVIALIVGTLLQTSRKLNNIKTQKYNLN